MKRMTAFAIVVAIVVAVMSANHSKAADLQTPASFAGRFSVTVTGTGLDVILVPGLGCSKAVWDQTVAQFKGKYRLHLLQVAGFAGEPARANAEGDMLKPGIEAIHTYITANHLKPVFVGHSYGGLMGLMLAQAHPDDLKSLVVVDALPFYALVYNPSATVDMVAPQAAQMRDAVIQSPDDAFAASQKRTSAYLVSSPENQAMIGDWTLKSDRKVFAKAFYEDMTTDIRAGLKANKVPTLILYPYSSATGRSAEATDAFYKSAFADMPLVTFKRIDQSLHFIMFDQPEAFQAALAEALK